MTVRSQDVNPNNAVLFSSLKTAIGSAAAAPVYSLPIDAEGYEGEDKGSFSGKPQEASASNLALAEQGTLNIQEAKAFPSETNFNPLVLPMSYGGAVMAAFLSMIDFLRQSAQQNYEVTISTAQGMIGTNGQNGLIASWVQAGMDAAKAQGEQIMFNAIGSLVGAVVSGVSVSFMAGGFIRNCTDGIGPFQTNRGKLSQELQDANNYRNLLDQPSKQELIAESKLEIRKLKDGTEMTRSPEIDSKVTLRKQELIEGVDINNYKGGTTPKDQQTEIAAQHLGAEEKVLAKKAADERKSKIEEQIGQGDAAQNNLVRFLDIIVQTGTKSGETYGGMTSSEQAIISGKQKATAEVMQQAGQTTEGVKEKATSKAQEFIQQMGQLAQEIARALAALVKG